MRQTDTPPLAMQESVSYLFSLNRDAIVLMKMMDYEAASELFCNALRMLEALYVQQGEAVLSSRTLMPRVCHVALNTATTLRACATYHLYTSAIALLAPGEKFSAAQQHDLVSMELLVELFSTTLHYNIGLALHLSAFSSERNNREFLLNQALAAYEMAQTEHDCCWDSTHPSIQGLLLAVLNNRGHIYHQYLDSEMDSCLEAMENLLDQITYSSKSFPGALMGFYQNVFHNSSKHSNEHLAA
eukprot:CAMPEP_0168790954 /NCGR_PEP_ID=MMETSP0725-20121227/13702_1 /TAXON_ID=265536 /ORGANISM="Amphiprora sp., Strain CCMP467" /LENGTH=242 /DNA_ID=CAMNT_0008841447 /DNA_START=62 /DNA_END=787 /DNA_ORIENTATION=+